MWQMSAKKKMHFSNPRTIILRENFLFSHFEFLVFKTKLIATVLKQDPYTQKVKKNTDFNRTTQNMGTFSGQTTFSKQQTGGQTMINESTHKAVN